jgi:hypothetical protein
MKTMVVFVALLVLLMPGAALTTNQRAEVIYLNGQRHWLHTLPLEEYYGPGNPRPNFTAYATFCWRGYIGVWEIRKGVLYLKDIQAWIDNKEVGLEALFPGHEGPVAATWFTGNLDVPQDKDAITYGYRTIYEKYLMITLEKGKMVRQETVEHPGSMRPPVR